MIANKETPQVPSHFDMRVTRLRYRHPMEPNFRRVVYQMLTQDNEATRVLVCYEWATEPHLLQVRIADLYKTLLLRCCAESAQRYAQVLVEPPANSDYAECVHFGRRARLGSSANGACCCRAATYVDNAHDAS